MCNANSVELALLSTLGLVAGQAPPGPNVRKKFFKKEEPRS